MTLVPARVMDIIKSHFVPVDHPTPLASKYTSQQNKTIAGRAATVMQPVATEKGPWENASVAASNRNSLKVFRGIVFLLPKREGVRFYVTHSVSALPDESGWRR